MLNVCTQQPTCSCSTAPAAQGHRAGEEVLVDMHLGFHVCQACLSNTEVLNLVSK